MNRHRGGHVHSEPVAESFRLATPSVVPLYQQTSLPRTRRSPGWHRVLREFAARSTIDQIVRPILADRELAKAVADASYSHQNGFDKIVLLRDQYDGLIKLDVCWAGHGVDGAAEKIHN